MFQNDLEEFFAMVNFTNPGSLGDAAHFRHYYEVRDIKLCSSLDADSIIPCSFICNYVKISISSR